MGNLLDELLRSADEVIEQEKQEGTFLDRLLRSADEVAAKNVAEGLAAYGKIQGLAEAAAGGAALTEGGKVVQPTMRQGPLYTAEPEEEMGALDIAASTVGHMPGELVRGFAGGVQNLQRGAGDLMTVPRRTVEAVGRFAEGEGFMPAPEAPVWKHGGGKDADAVARAKEYARIVTEPGADPARIWEAVELAREHADGSTFLAEVERLSARRAVRTPGEAVGEQGYRGLRDFLGGIGASARHLGAGPETRALQVALDQTIAAQERGDPALSGSALANVVAKSARVAGPMLMGGALYRSLGPWAMDMAWAGSAMGPAVAEARAAGLSGQEAINYGLTTGVMQAVTEHLGGAGTGQLWARIEKGTDLRSRLAILARETLAETLEESIAGGATVALKDKFGLERSASAPELAGRIIEAAYNDGVDSVLPMLLNVGAPGGARVMLENMFRPKAAQPEARKEFRVTPLTVEEAFARNPRAAQAVADIGEQGGIPGRKLADAALGKATRSSANDRMALAKMFAAERRRRAVVGPTTEETPHAEATGASAEAGRRETGAEAQTPAPEGRVAEGGEGPVRVRDDVQPGVAAPPVEEQALSPAEAEAWFEERRADLGEQVPSFDVEESEGIWYLQQQADQLAATQGHAGMAFTAAGEVPAPTGFQPQGAATTIVFSGNRQVPAQYAVVEASRLVASHGFDPESGQIRPRPEYGIPQAQKRDYENKPERDKLKRHMDEKVYGFYLNTSPSPADGPPIVRQDGQVVSGNGRTIVVQEWIREGSSAGYEEAVQASLPQFGLKPEDVKGIEHPVIVRVIQGIVPAGAAGERANIQAGNALGAIAEATSYAELIPDSVMRKIEVEEGGTLSEMLTSGSKSLDFRTAFRQAIEEVAPQQTATYFDKDAPLELTAAGKVLAVNVVLAKVFGNVEGLGVIPAGWRSILEQSLPLLLSGQEVNADQRYNMIPQLREVLALHSRVLATGQEWTPQFIDDIINQKAMFQEADLRVSPAARMLLDALAQMNNMSRKFRESFKEWLAFRKAGNLLGAQTPEGQFAEAFDVPLRDGSRFGPPEAPPAGAAPTVRASVAEAPGKIAKRARRARAEAKKAETPRSAKLGSEREAEAPAPPVAAPAEAPAKGILSAEERAAAAALKKQFFGASPGALAAPQLEAALKLGALYFKAGVREFAKWSATMIEELGEAIKPHLQALWDKLQPKAEPQELTPQEAGKMMPGRGPLRMTNAQVDDALLSLGLPPATHGQRVTFEQAQEQAASVLAAKPNAAQDLMASFVANPRPATYLEDILLLHEWVRLTNERDGAREAMETAKRSGDAAGLPAAQQQYSDASGAYQAAADIVTITGTNNALGLAFRKMWMNRDFSLARMEAEEAAARGRPLTREELDRVAELQRQIAERDKEIARLTKENQEAERERETAAAVKKMVEEKKDRPPMPRGAARRADLEKRAAQLKKELLAALSGAQMAGGVTPANMAKLGELLLVHAELAGWKFVDAVEAFVKDLGEKIGAYAKPLWDQYVEPRRKAALAAERQKTVAKAAQIPPASRKLSRIANKLAKSFVEEGMEDRDEVVQAVWGELQKIAPEITREETEDAISRIGQYKLADKSEVAVVMRRIHGELLQLGKIRRMEAGQAPPATGQQRLPPETEERRLTKIVNELKRRGGYDARSAEGQLKSAVDTIETRMTNALMDMEQQLRTGQEIVKGKTRVILPERLKALKERYDETREYFKMAFRAKKELTPEQQGRALMKWLNSDLKREEGRQRRIWRKAERAAAKARRETARLEAAMLRMALHPKRSAFEKAKAALMARYAREYSDYADRVARGDFEERPKTRTEVQQQVARDEEIARAKFQAAQMKGLWREQVLKLKIANYPVYKKAGRWINTILRLFPAIRASVDLSATYIQGGAFTIPRPDLVKKMVAIQLQAFLSKERQFQAEEAMRNDPEYRLALEGGMEFTKEDTLEHREEAFQSELAKYIPLVAGSSRAFTTGLNWLRFTVFKQLLSTHRAWVGSEPTVEDLKLYANLANTGTGRGSMGNGRFADFVRAISGIYWTPRLNLSRLQFLLHVPLAKALARKRWGAAKVIAWRYAQLYLGIGTIYGLAMLANVMATGDDDELKVELNPLSSDFLKLRWGKTRVPVVPGYGSLITFFARLATGKMKTFDNKIVDMSRDRVLANLSRTKLAPATATAWDLMMGKKYRGEPLRWWNVARDLIFPIAATEIFDNLVQQGTPGSVAATLLSLVGFGVQVHGQDWWGDGKARRGAGLRKPRGLRGLRTAR